MRRFSLQARIKQVSTALKKAKLPFGATAKEPKELESYEFKKDSEDYGVYWDVRKGLIPIVGAARETGTSFHRKSTSLPPCQTYGHLCET